MGSGTSGFADNRGRLFGRARDLDHLLARAEHKGLTAVAGRPRMGKTWLFTELCRTLSEGRGYLVGYAFSTGEEADLLLRSVSDLYARWLRSASFKDQAKSLWDRHKKEGLIARFGQKLVGVVEKVASLAGPAVTVLAKSVGEVIGTLAKADTDLRTGGLAIKRLGYDQARDLVAVLAHLAAHPIALVLDAWETLHSDISRPFDKPEGGRIAVKVINHLGDEVMKVFRAE